MNIPEKVKNNARKIIKNCCDTKKGERVIIITDTEQPAFIARALHDCVLECEGVPLIITMEKCLPGNPLPLAVEKALEEADIIVTPTTTSIYHSESIHKACARANNPARLLTLSECSEDMMSGGGIDMDFLAVKPVIDKVGFYYENGSTISYKTPAGTDITASIAGRPVCLNDGLSHKGGQKNGIPTLEVFIAPVEESVNGKIVVDASCSGGVGKIVDKPIEITVVNGKATEITGGVEAEKLKKILASAGTDAVYQVAELAIGLNPYCRITGNIVEDEGKYGTCHMALGSNTGFYGKNSAPLHIDMVQYAPTIVIDGTVICENGELKVAQMIEF